MHGEAYRQSSVIARDHGGPFLEYDVNRAPFLRVIGKHRDAAYAAAKERRVPQDVLEAARVVFDEALELGKDYGYRNAQVTVLAPTGTIAFMMDCDTTGIEPDIALIKYKKLVGEGFLKIVNQTVPAALRKLGYGAGRGRGDPRLHQRAGDDRGRPGPQAGAPAGLRLRVQAGQRRALDPLHGPRPDDVGGPAVHLRRDQQDREHARGRHGRGDRVRSTSRAGSWASRRSRSTATAASAASRSAPARRRTRAPPSSRPLIAQLQEQLANATVEAGKPHRRRLPAERTAVTHKFDIAGHEGYITVGLYPDGQPGEIFLKMAKEGSTVSGLMDSFATTVSVALQYGVPLRDLVNKFAHVRFEPSGFTGNSEIPIAKSHRGLHLPVAGLAVPDRRRQGGLGLIDRSSVGRRAAGSPPRRRSASAAQLRAPRRLRADAPADPAPARRSDRRAEPSRGRSSPRPRAVAALDVERRAAPRAERVELGYLATVGAPRMGTPMATRTATRNGNAPKRRERRRDHAQPGRHQGRLRHPGRRPVVHGLRLDHGSQRLLLQVPQLRLAPAAAAEPKAHTTGPRGPSSSTGPSHFLSVGDVSATLCSLAVSCVCAWRFRRTTSRPRSRRLIPPPCWDRSCRLGRYLADELPVRGSSIT